MEDQTMPWKQSVSEMEQREAFIREIVKGRRSITEACELYGISRVLGHKLLRRYEEEGKQGLAPRSRRPKSCSFVVKEEIICRVVRLRTEHPRWGSAKLQQMLLDEYEECEVPSERTITRILDRSGLISIRKRRRQKKHLSSGKLVAADCPNRVWTADIKGWWRTRDGKIVYPLTIRDEYSRFILDIGALQSCDYFTAKRRFHRCFELYGMPDYIRTDNGAPFAAVRSLQGLTRLSADWVRRGTCPERILPASPYMNGGHERMHRDIKAELQCRPLRNWRSEQKRFDEWREEFNTIRPHQALKNKRPAQLYAPSERRYQRKTPDYAYPQDMETRRVGLRGNITWKSKETFISHALEGQTLGIRYENDRSLSVWFCELKLGETDANFSLPLGGDLY